MALASAILEHTMMINDEEGDDTDDELMTDQHLLVYWKELYCYIATSCYIGIYIYVLYTFIAKMHIPLPIYIHTYHTCIQTDIHAAQQPAERRGILGGERQRVGSQPGFRPEGALAMPGGKHV